MNDMNVRHEQKATITLDVPEVRDESRELALQVDAMPVITTDDELTVANGILKACAERKKQIEAIFADCVKAAHQAHKTLTGKRAEMLAPYDALDRSMRTRINAYLRDQEIKRLAEQRAREAEARRIQEEAAAAEAARLEAEGRTREAEAVIEQAIAAPAPVVPIQTTPREAMAGNRIVTRFGYAVDLPALIAAAAANASYRQYLLPNDALIGQIVRSQKMLTQIPGVTVHETKEVSR